MRILYDGFIYGLQKSGGINRYFNEVINRLPTHYRKVIYGNYPPIPLVSKHERVKCVGILPRILHSIAGIAANYFDVVHPTYYELTPPLNYSRIKARCVVTIHDFIIARYEERFPKGRKVIVAQEQAIKRADSIICISESTKSDLINRFPECENRCSVIHLASSMEYRQEPLDRDIGLNERPYCLYVGSRIFYKNFNWCLDAVVNLKRRGVDMDLIVVGSSWTSEEKALLQNSGVSDRVELIEYPTDTILSVLYQKAVALLYPSSYEGFGLPPLEAMTMGCPVIAQRSSSLPEVIGDGGVLMDVASAGPLEIADILEHLWHDGSLRSEISLKARAQAANFSWDKTVKKTLDVYQGYL